MNVRRTTSLFAGVSPHWRIVTLRDGTARMSVRFLTFQIIALLLLEQAAHAQRVRPFPDPGYRRMGVYGGGPDSYFDYNLVKLSLGETFPNKKQHWAGLMAGRKDKDHSHKHDIYLIYCGERSDSLEAIKARIDAWLKREQEGNDAIESLVLRDEGQLKDRHDFYLRLSMENHAEGAALPGNRFDRLRVECVHQPPPTGAAARLVADDYGNLTYEDEFSTARWRHFGEVKAGHKEHGGYRGDGFWVGMVGGYATSAQLLQRIASPRKLKQLVVTVDCYADGKNLGGRIVLQIGPRDEPPRWETSTKGLHRGPLRLAVSAGELNGLQDFDVRTILRSTSGVEGGQRACATLNRLVIHAK